MTDKATLAANSLGDSFDLWDALTVTVLSEARRSAELNPYPEICADADVSSEVASEFIDTRLELNCGILLISHDLHTVMSATDHVVCLNGHVCCSGSPMDVAKNNEYKALFGEQASQILSRYEHRHDHVHTSEGEIKKN